MNIDPELLRQIQVEGITDDDYRRVEPKIETIKQMAALSMSGLFIFDSFKMDILYMSPNCFIRDVNNKDSVSKISFIESQATSEGMKWMWMACAYAQDFYRKLPAESRNGYITHWNYAALCKSGKQILSSKCVPLEFAKDGRIWLTLETFTTTPDCSKEPFCIYNPKDRVLWSFSLRTKVWERKTLATLSDMEEKIIKMMAMGNNVRDIAMELSKSEDTIRSHQKALFKKLGAHTAIEAVGIAKKYGLIRQWLF